jgi:hypothetical protein
MKVREMTSDARMVHGMGHEMCLLGSLPANSVAQTSATNVSSQLLELNAVEGNSFHHSIVTCYESKFHQFYPETKQQHGIASHSISQKKSENCSQTSRPWELSFGMLKVAY